MIDKNFKPKALTCLLSFIKAYEIFKLKSFYGCVHVRHWRFPLNCLIYIWFLKVSISIYFKKISSVVFRCQKAIFIHLAGHLVCSNSEPIELISRKFWIVGVYQCFDLKSFSNQIFYMIRIKSILSNLCYSPPLRIVSFLYAIVYASKFQLSKYYRSDGLFAFDLLYQTLYDF